MKFEHRTQRLATPAEFAARQLKFLLAALVIVGLSLAVGTWGYVHYAHYATVDAFLNASMILGGMGPIGDLPNNAAKYFASFYALYSGFALLTTVAVILTPMVHRGLHSLHLDESDSDEQRRR